nr:winged helix-turn-helix domain-containing protein [Rhodococcus kroppenstedtii]
MDAVVRRTVGRAATPAAPDPGFRFDPDTREIWGADGTPRALTAKESELLVALSRTPGRPVSRAALMEEVWDTTWVGASRTLDVHVASLRAKLRDLAAVESVRGVGYRLVVTADRDETSTRPE